LSSGVFDSGFLALFANTTANTMPMIATANVEIIFNLRFGLVA
jgi:hypothetical protein